MLLHNTEKFYKSHYHIIAEKDRCVEDKPNKTIKINLILAFYGRMVTYKVCYV